MRIAKKVGKFLVVCKTSYCIAHDGWNTPPPRYSFFFLDRVRSLAFWIWTTAGTDFLIMYG